MKQTSTITLRILLLVLFVIQFCLNVAASTDFQDCFNRVQTGAFGIAGVVDSNGNQVTSLTQAAGLTYEACKANCGSGNEAFNWQYFSTELRAWLLPWLALVSQLPFGANDLLSNFETVLLTVGSPMLAAYSLALAVIGNRWMVKRFRGSTHRNSFYAARILRNLQQVSFSIIDEHVLPSLVVLRENDVWWQQLDEALDYPSPRWTLAATISMGYVALAYTFTWADTLIALKGDFSDVVTASGQLICSIWLSLFPIVICNLQLSPKSDTDRIKKAVETTAKSFYIVTENGGVEQTTNSRAIIVKTASRDLEDEDQLCSTPICFYARIFSWIQTSGRVADVFDIVSHSSDASKEEKGDGNTRTRSEVVESCKLDNDRSPFYATFHIHMISFLLAVLLQWGTTGAPIMAVYLTPTRGLGCHSGSYTLYGILATIVWILFVTSSALAQSFSASRKLGRPRKVAGALAILFRQAGKVIAAINTIWLITFTLFEFGTVFHNCYCDSSVLGLGSKAYAVLYLTPEDQSLTKTYWTAGMVMASVTALVFVVVINLLFKRPEKHS